MIRKSLSAVSMMVLVALCPAMGGGDMEIKDPVQVKQQFNEVMARLDPGGDLLIVANMDGVVKDTMDSILALFGAIPVGAPEMDEVKKTVERLSAYLDRSGFYAINGWGMSIVPRDDGMNDIKTFLSRDAAAAGLPLWRAVVGLKPRRLAGLDYFPKDTVLAVTSAGQLGAFWSLIRNGAAEVLSPEGQKAFNEFVSTSSTNMGVSLDKLMASMGDQGFYAVQLSSSETVPLPAMDAEGKPLRIPSPSLLLGLAVKDMTLADMIEANLVKAGMTPTKVDIDGVTVSTVMMPLPLPVPLQPTFAVHDGMFLFGSQQQVVREALAAYKTKNGFAASAEFKKAFQDLSLENNGMSYVSPRLGKTLINVQTMAMGMSGQAHPQSTNFLRDLMAKQGLQSTAMVRINWKSGVVSRGRSTSGGKEMLMSALMLPVGIMAGVAIPSFVQARTMSQGNSCINNLRQIDAAKEQWALASGAADGDAVDPEGVAEYIKGNAIPTCPQGGAYMLGPVGAAPTCTESGHEIQ